MIVKNVYMRYGTGYIGCDPTPQKTKLVPTGQIRGRITTEVVLNGDEQFPVYHDRTAANGWEALELTKQDSGQFSAQFLDANRQLTINFVTGELETREAGVVESWQLFNAAKQPDGQILLWLAGDPRPSVVLVVEEIQ